YRFYNSEGVKIAGARLRTGTSPAGARARLRTGTSPAGAESSQGGFAPLELL
ncbi:hypothetical protein H4S08_002883, partial [Coemansia sp. RSA 1365]